MFERPRGTRDFLPEDNLKRRNLEAVFRGVSETFGYGEVVTPTFEHAELFIAKSGPGVLEEMYAFKDKAGRELALRPELTAPVVRLYLNEMTRRSKPVKVYYIGNCFRYDEPQLGRYREFWQYGVEILGGNPLDADAEVIATAVEVLRGAGISGGLELRIGHIGIFSGLIDAPPQAKARILGRLDKRDFEGLRRELEVVGHGELESTLRQVASLRGPQALTEGRRILQGEEALRALDHLAALREILEAYGVRDITYDLGVVRGLDYYSGMVFEIHYQPLGSASQLCGGGTYSLTEVFGGEPISTTGFGMGFDRVELAREREGIPLPSPDLLAFVVPIGEGVRPRAIALVQELRRAGLTADFDLVRRGPSKNLDYANSRRARYAVVVGEKELAVGTVALRDLATGEQNEVPLGDLVTRLKEASRGGRPQAPRRGEHRPSRGRAPG